MSALSAMQAGKFCPQDLQNVAIDKSKIEFPISKIDLKSDVCNMLHFIKQIYSIVALVTLSIISSFVRVPFLLADFCFIPLRPNRESGHRSQALIGVGCSEMRICKHSSNLICLHLAVNIVTRCQRYSHTLDFLFHVVTVSRRFFSPPISFIITQVNRSETRVFFHNSTFTSE